MSFSKSKPSNYVTKEQIERARNVDMVEIANAVVSYKKYDSAGTDHCIKEAKKRNKYLGNIPDILLEKQND